MIELARAQQGKLRETVEHPFNHGEGQEHAAAH